MRIFQGFKIKKIFLLFLLNIFYLIFLHADFIYVGKLETYCNNKYINFYQVTGNDLITGMEDFVRIGIDLYCDSNSCSLEDQQVQCYANILRSQFYGNYFQQGIFIAAYNFNNDCWGWVFFKRTGDNELVLDYNCSSISFILPQNKKLAFEIERCFVLSPLFLLSLPRINKICVPIFCFLSKDIINLYEAIAPCQISKWNEFRMMVEYQVSSTNIVLENLEILHHQFDFLRVSYNNLWESVDVLRKKYKSLKYFYYLDLMWINAFYSNIIKTTSYAEIVKLGLIKEYIKRCKEILNYLGLQFNC